MVLTQKKILFFTLILLILYSNTINTISQGTSVIIDGDLSDYDELELNSDNPIIIITQAKYHSDLHQIQLKYDLSIQQDTTITTPNTALFYYSIGASSNESWHFPTVVLPAVTPHSFEKGTYSYERNFTLDIEESNFKPNYFDIEVGLCCLNLDVSDSCRINKEDNYSIIHDIPNPLFTSGFVSWLLFTSFTSLAIIRIKQQRKKTI